jgi:hypothetical protein
MRGGGEATPKKKGTIVVGLRRTGGGRGKLFVRTEWCGRGVELNEAWEWVRDLNLWGEGE